MAEFVKLWYTSGTVINTGQRDCAYKRWIGYSAGKHGTGWRKRATAIPLATGSGTHRGMEMVGKWLIDWQAAHAGLRLFGGEPLLQEVIAWGASAAASEYAENARSRGLELTNRDVDTVAATEQLILEQATLIEAQVWVYCLGRLPVMLADHVLVNVEVDENPVIDCTCGLGDWVADSVTHAARGCAGIVLQGKADFIWRNVTSGKFKYEEFKTKATPNYGWEMAWEHSGQLLINMEAASQRLGVDVDEAFVPVLFKGRRDRSDWNDKTSPKIQQSPLVYGYYDPGNGMLRPPEWASRYKWYDDYGKGHTLPRTFKRTLITDQTIDLPSGNENPNGVTFRSGASRVERWVTGWILPIQYPELLKVLGPFPKPRIAVEDRIQSVRAEERKWREDLKYLRECQVFTPTDVRRDITLGPITAADIIPRSWNCTNFDGTPCAFKWVCHREVGSENGIENNPEFEIRRPHHETELEAFQAHGVVFPTDDTETEGDPE